MAIVLTCPYCNGQSSVTDPTVQTVQCPHCGQLIGVPEVQPAPASARSSTHIMERCAACGKAVRSDSLFEVDGRAMCALCAQRLMPAETQSPEPAASEAWEDVAAPVSYTSSFTPPRPRSRSAAPLITAIIVCGVIAAGAVFYFRNKPSTDSAVARQTVRQGEPDNPVEQNSSEQAKPATQPTQSAATDPAVLEEAEKLLAEANTAVSTGGKTLAHQKYRELFTLIAQKQVEPSESLKAQLAEAEKTFAALSDDLMKDPQNVRKTVDLLFAQGLASFDRNQYPAGLEMLWDAKLLMDAQNEANRRADEGQYVQVMQAIACGYLLSGEAKRAADLFEASQTLGIAAEANPTTDLLWNRAIIDLKDGSRIGRSLTGVMQFLKTDETQPPDERMLNLLGTLLNAANTSAPNAETAKVLPEAIAYYQKRNAQLEATRPGMMHWGVQWLSGGEADKVKKQLEEANRTYAKLQKDLAETDKRLVEIRRGERKQVQTGGGATITVTRVNEELLKRFTDERTQRAKALNDARSLYPAATWLAPEQLMPALPKATSATVAADFKPARHAIAIPIDRYRLLTAAGPLGNATSVQLEDPRGPKLTARVVKKGEHLALLEVDPATAKPFSFFNFAIGFSGGSGRCAAMPMPSVFGPNLDVFPAKNLPAPPINGPWTFALDRHPRLPGAVILDESNRLLGIVISNRDEPKEKLSALGLLAIQEFLQSADALPKEESTTTDSSAFYEVTIETK